MFRSLAALVACVSLSAAACGNNGKKVDVDLTEWAVQPSVTEISAGSVTFAAHNRSTTMVHELAILKVDGATKTKVKEIEDIDPGKGKDVSVKLSPGLYELACVIVPGEAGSTSDHYQQGMHTTIVVR
jgi:uncharacterized cupredoxin-like copper-binding protein